MTKQINIGDIKFNTQKSAINFFKKILNTGGIGRILDEEETNQLTSLLNLHPKRSEKIGAGIESIGITESSHGTRCFVINRTDGTSIDFSYLKCIKGDHKPFTEFSNACRQAVQARLHEWKVSQFDSTKAKCENTNEYILWNQAHVKHKPPMTFNTIVNKFLIHKNIDLSTIEYDRESAEGVQFKNQQIADDFDKFHEERAVLKFVHHKQKL